MVDSYSSPCCCCSLAQLCTTFCDPKDCSTPGFPVHHQLQEFTQTHVHWVKDAIQPSHPLSSPSPPAFTLSQHQGLFQWVGCLHQVSKVLELQLQHQSFQWIFRTDFLQDWLVWSPCLPRDSQESSPTPQFEGINSSALSLFYCPALTSVNGIQLHNWGQHVGPVDSSLCITHHMDHEKLVIRCLQKPIRLFHFPRRREGGQDEG